MKKWKEQFPEFEFDPQSKKMRCKACHEAGTITDFLNGRISTLSALLRE